MSITRFRPLGDIVTLRDAMDRLFEDSELRRTGAARRERAKRADGA